MEPLSDVKKNVLKALDKADRTMDRALMEIGKRVGFYRSPLVVTYRGHGTSHRIYLKGRVLEDPRLPAPQDEDSLVKNATGMVKRFATAELPKVRLRASYGVASQEVETDEEGYFRVDLQLDEPAPEDRHWHEVQIDLLESPFHERVTDRVFGEAIIPPSGAQFGVISDVDDTILQTGATNFLKMVRTTFLENALTRLPFEGVAAFYRALTYGTNDTADNPFFYVSSSPWNLYDFLSEFMNIQGIPRGPLFLRDLGIDKTKFIKSGHGTHKLSAVRDLLLTHPDLPFILIGDSGQEDPEIYAEAARTWPERIRCIYIRDVADEKRDAEVQDIAAELALEDIEMVLVRDSLEAALHALERGFVTEDSIAEVAAEKAKDEAAETGEAGQISAPAPV